MNGQEAQKLYYAGKSIRDICKIYDSYPSQVHSVLKRENTVFRTKGEAQSLNIKTGKVPHPTKGTVRDFDTKLKISEKLQKRYENMTEVEKNQRSVESKENWDKRTDQEKLDFMSQGHKAIRDAAEVGSKMEHYLVQEILEAGFMAAHHKNRMLSNTNLEVDILVSDIKTVIEVDGPSHQLPIWGDESLEKRKRSDEEKNGLLLNAGYVVIRFKFNNSKMSIFKQNEAKNNLITILQDIKTEFPSDENRYIEVIIE